MEIVRTDITKLLINVKYSDASDDGDDTSSNIIQVPLRKLELLIELDMKDLFFPMFLCNITDMDDYADVPAHWKYLKETIPTKKYLDGFSISHVIILEKYQNVAIAYDLTLSKKPVAIFRYCCGFYENLQCGKVFKGKIGKLFVKTPEKPTLILTDLFVDVSTLFTVPPPYPVISNSNDFNVTMKDFAFSMSEELHNIKEYENCHVIYNHFGAIFIPSEVFDVFDSADSFIICDIAYRIRGVKADLYTCWELGKSVKIYKGTSLYATFQAGRFTFAKPRQILEFSTGTRILQYVKPEIKEAVEKERVKLADPRIRKHGIESFGNDFAAERQRPSRMVIR